MYQMAKLMEESLNLTVFHEPFGKILGKRRQRYLTVFDTGSDCPVGSVLILAGARVIVHVESANDRAVINQLKGFDIFMPGLGFPGLYGDFKKVLHQLENAITYPIVRKIGSHQLCIKRVVLLSKEVGQVGKLPGLHLVSCGINLSQAGQENTLLALQRAVQRCANCG